MAEIFQAKLRNVGNSLGIIIPNEILSQLGYSKGDMVHITIPALKMKSRNKLLKDIAGSDYGKKGFERDKRDRF